jgi:serine/threonine protein phosphatase PrpC
MFAVYDGHAGSTVVDKLQEHLLRLLSSRFLQKSYVHLPLWPAEDVEKTLYQAFHDFDMEHCQLNECGSTAVLLIQHHRQLFSVNTGDSRLVLLHARTGDIIHTTIDHKPSLPSERTRIEKALCNVTLDETVLDVPRINGTLAVSRVFGDFMFKTKLPNAPCAPVCVTPDVSYTYIYDAPQCDDVVLVMASDGLWDVVTTREVSDLVVFSMHNTSIGMRALPELLMRLAIQYRHASDNILILATHLSFSLSLSSSSPSKSNNNTTS